MTKRTLHGPLWLALAVALAGCPADTDDPAPAADDVTEPGDTASDEDTGPAPEDTGPPPVDTGPPPEDTGPPPEDTVPPPEDTSPPPEDTGPPPEDIGPPPEDAGPPPEDTVGPPPCASPCDCEQGFDCVDGACLLGVQATLCCSNAGCTADQPCVGADGSPGLCGVDTSPIFGQVVFNEVLSDGATDGDPNQDGESADPVGDEFVELVNASGAEVDLAGFTLVETTLAALPRHTFAPGTKLPAGHALVVFGGGSAPDDSATAQYMVANANDPGLTFGLSLDNAAETLRLLDADGKLVALFAYGPGAALDALSDQSWTRDPDVTGGFVPHSSLSLNVPLIFSPGTKNDGGSF